MVPDHRIIEEVAQTTIKKLTTIHSSGANKDVKLHLKMSTILKNYWTEFALLKNTRYFVLKFGTQYSFYDETWLLSPTMGELTTFNFFYNTETWGIFLKQNYVAT